MLNIRTIEGIEVPVLKRTLLSEQRLGEPRSQCVRKRLISIVSPKLFCVPKLLCAGSISLRKCSS